MYPLDWIERVRSARSLNLEGISRFAVNSNVWKLGFTSFFTDISSEMVSSILPLYFISYLRFSPLEFGVLDGIYQGAAVALLSLLSGIYADRWRRQKELAVVGYGFSTFSKLGLLAVGGVWTSVAGILALDRVGKGIRTAPRDAMISLSSRSENMATAFAVHRTLDAGGAVLGPLVAYLLLRSAPGAFDTVLVVSFFIALIGLGLILLLVNRPVVQVGERASEKPSFRVSFDLWKQSRFRAISIAGGMLALATASDGFVYLVLQRNTKSSASVFPLFAFMTAVFYVLLSVPAGRLADSWGRSRVFVGGYSLLALIYILLLIPGLGAGLQFAVLALFGAYYAATDGVIASMASATLTPEFRTTGLALLNTTTGLCRLIASVVFGWLWNSGSNKIPLGTFLTALLAGILISAVILAERSKSE